MRTLLLFAALAFAIAARPALSQSPAKVPVRTIGPATVVSNEGFTAIAGIRELPDGRVLVSDISEQRLVVLDRSLRNPTPVGRTGSGPGEYGSVGRLIAARGDTSYLVDFGNQRLLIITPAAKILTTQTITAGVSGGVANQILTGVLVVDPRGRIVHQGPTLRFTAQGQIESDAYVPILRRDVASPRVDTLARVRVYSPRVKTSGTIDAMKMTMTVEPFPVIDDWAMLSDGTLAVIRGADMHIDWIGADGRAWSTPPIPYERQRVTPEDKTRFLESLRRSDSLVRAELTKNAADDGDRAPQIVKEPPAKWPEFKPPFSGHGAMAPLDGTLWFPAPRGGTDRAAYIVIDRQGRVVQRIRVPAGRIIAGFGKNTVYLMRRDADDLWYLERVNLR